LDSKNSKDALAIYEKHLNQTNKLIKFYEGAKKLNGIVGSKLPNLSPPPDTFLKQMKKYAEDPSSFKNEENSVETQDMSTVINSPRGENERKTSKTMTTHSQNGKLMDDIFNGSGFDLVDENRKFEEDPFEGKNDHDNPFEVKNEDPFSEDKKDPFQQVYKQHTSPQPQPNKEPQKQPQIQQTQKQPQNNSLIDFDSLTILQPVKQNPSPRVEEKVVQKEPQKEPPKPIKKEDPFAFIQDFTKKEVSKPVEQKKDSFDDFLSNPPKNPQVEKKKDDFDDPFGGGSNDKWF